MTASELRELATRLTKIVPADLAQAAEVLELVAWAESRRVNIIWGDRPTVIVPKNDVTTGDTLIGTLRRAKEASNG